MKILIDMWHPADVHFFRNFIGIMKEKGHKVLVTSREKDVTSFLLDQYHIPHKNLTRKGKGILGLTRELLLHDYHLFKIARKFQPDILLGFGGMSIAHIGRLLGKPALSFYDTEHATLIKLVTLPFITKVYTPEKFGGDWGRKHVRLNSYKELAYLHPKFYSPDKAILKKLGIKEGEKYFVLRFVSWDASHDLGIKKIGLDTKRKLLTLLEKKGKVFISAEDNSVPADLKPYLLPTKANEFMDVLAFANLVISEGGTTSTECGVLGVPAIYINPLRCGHIDEEIHEYQLFPQITEDEKLLKEVEKMLKNPKLQEQCQEKRRRLLQEKEDMTSLMIREVEKWGN